MSYTDLDAIVRFPDKSPNHAMLYAITDRRSYGMNEAEARTRLLDQVAIWAANGVEFIQLREKDLSGCDQVELARAMLRIVHAAQPNSTAKCATRLLINSRPDVAVAAGADGVHLPSGPDALTPEEVRAVFALAGQTQPPFLSVSCHTLPEVQIVRKHAADCILFAPVFEKVIVDEISGKSIPRILPGTGLASLAEACQIASSIPVFALGGVTAENAAQCLQAGAAGIAAIRLLQEPPSIWQHLL